MKRPSEGTGPDVSQELPEARISEQNEQNGPVIRDEVGKLGRG